MIDREGTPLEVRGACRVPAVRSEKRGSWGRGTWECATEHGDETAPRCPLVAQEVSRGNSAAGLQLQVGSQQGESLEARRRSFLRERGFYIVSAGGWVSLAVSLATGQCWVSLTPVNS